MGKKNRAARHKERQAAKRSVDKYIREQKYSEKPHDKPEGRSDKR